jgi:glutamyl-Q tRNA(Asp) synthetase
VATTAHGEKLSKQVGAPAIEPARAVETLCDALEFLGQSPPPELRRATLPALWAWARSQWRLERVPVMAAVAGSGHGG